MQCIRRIDLRVHCVLTECQRVELNAVFSVSAVCCSLFTFSLLQAFDFVLLVLERTFLCYFC